MESAGGKSDHATINYECKLNRPATFAWETHEYLKLTEEGIQGFCEKVECLDWDEVEKVGQDVDEMTREFHRILDKLIGEFFV